MYVYEKNKIFAIQGGQLDPKIIRLKFKPCTKEEMN